jgi:gluconolactonase
LLAAEVAGRSLEPKGGTITVPPTRVSKGRTIWSTRSTAASISPIAEVTYQITVAQWSRRRAAKGEVRVVAETPAPNGVALSPNQQQLYVADVKTNVVKIHDIQVDGKLGAGRDFAPVRVDGLKTDERGNVWMASPDGIYVYDAGGQHLGTIKTEEGPSNCCWGDGFRSLYITARKSVYQIPTKVSGTRTF